MYSCRGSIQTVGATFTERFGFGRARGRYEGKVLAVIVEIGVPSQVDGAIVSRQVWAVQLAAIRQIKLSELIEELLRVLVTCVQIQTFGGCDGFGNPCAGAFRCRRNFLFHLEKEANVFLELCFFYLDSVPIIDTECNGELFWLQAEFLRSICACLFQVVD